MKITREFVYINRSGDAGWLLHDKPHFDPLSSYRAHVLVHDIMEHCNQDDDTFETELMALGATYWVRVLGGWCRFLRDGDRGADVQYRDIFGFLQTNDYKVKPLVNGDIHPDLMYYFETSERQFYRNHPEKRETHPNVVRDVYKWVSLGYVRIMNQWAGHEAHEVLNSVWEPMWHFFGGRAYTRGISKDHDWTVEGNRMIVTMDTVTLEWSIDFKGKSITAMEAEEDELFRKSAA